MLLVWQGLRALMEIIIKFAPVAIFRPVARSCLMTAGSLPALGRESWYLCLHQQILR
jgi:hypothetical protein